MKDMLVLRVVAKFFIPYLLLFALYILLHGELSPGGGFQAGVIFAAAFMLYALVWGSAKLLNVVTVKELTTFACVGVLIYAGTGIASLFLHGNFLEYSKLLHDAPSGHKAGVMLVETGVGITVFSVMLLLFVLFVTRIPLPKGKR